MSIGTRRAVFVCLIVGFAVVFSSSFHEAEAANAYNSFIQDAKSKCQSAGAGAGVIISWAVCWKAMQNGFTYAASEDPSALYKGCYDSCDRSTLPRPVYYGCQGFCKAVFQ